MINLPTLRQIPNLMIRLALKYGVIGLGIGTFLESLGIPFASIGLQLAAGSLIESGRVTFLEALFVSTAGLVLGSTASYYIGYYGGQFARRTIHRPKSATMRSLTAPLDRYGALFIALAQLYGPARTWISIPAGVARMNIRVFIIATAIGGVAYCAIAISLSLILTTVIKDIIKSLSPLTSIYIAIGIIVLVATVILILRSIKRRRASSI